MSRINCERCLRPQNHCLCPLIPSLESRTRVVLLQHPSEVRHALNTARLAGLGLRNAELRVGEVFDDLHDLIATPVTGLPCCSLAMKRKRLAPTVTTRTRVPGCW